MIKMTEEQAKALRNAVAEKMGDINPFIEIDGKSFMRYDKIRIYQDKDLAVAEFFWRGILVTSIPTRCTFSDNEQLNLDGIEGKIEFRWM